MFVVAGDVFPPSNEHKKSLAQDYSQNEASSFVKNRELVDKVLDKREKTLYLYRREKSREPRWDCAFL